MNLLLLDKDGTLIAPRSNVNKFVNDPWDQEPLPNTFDILREYAAAAGDWQIAIISNQGGIKAGHKSLENCILEMKFALQLFPQIEEAYFCPDFGGGTECWRVWGDCQGDKRILYNKNSPETSELGIENQFRKPNPGMLKLAASLHSFDEIMYVGDRPEDEGAASAASIPFQWAAEFFGF